MIIRNIIPMVREVAIDNVQGWGGVPYNQDVDYFGLRVLMRPSMFLKLAMPLGVPHSADIEKHIKSGGAIAAPFFHIAIPDEWREGNYDRPASVNGHEGRNRMSAIQKLEGDAPVEVHLFPRGGLRARDISPDMIKHLNLLMQAERSDVIVNGPIFQV